MTATQGLKPFTIVGDGDVKELLVCDDSAVWLILVNFNAAALIRPAHMARCSHYAASGGIYQMLAEWSKRSLVGSSTLHVLARCN